jgi:transcriptional regulator with XRE-family HTH domain
MWLDILKSLKKEKGLSTKQIAEKTNLPERTVNRIFSGDTDNPYMTTLIPIVNVLGGSLDDIFADTKVVVATETVVELQENVAELQENVETVSTEKELLLAENKILQDKVCNLERELELTKMKLMHKEELLAVHNYYTKLKTE